KANITLLYLWTMLNLGLAILLIKVTTENFTEALSSLPAQYFSVSCDRISPKSGLAIVLVFISVISFQYALIRMFIRLFYPTFFGPKVLFIEQLQNLMVQRCLELSGSASKTLKYQFLR